MSKKQLLALFLCYLIIWTVGSGLLPLLPVYATQLGADPAVAGYYLSFSFLALAMGTMVAGWLSDNLQRRKTTLIVSGVVAFPAIWLMGQATNVWQLGALTASVWFLAGMGITLLGVLTGLFAEEAERGKIFGILALTGTLGRLIGGLASGPIVDRWGFPTLFAVLSLFWSLLPLTALLLADKVVACGRTRDRSTPTSRSSLGLGGSFYLLLLASLAVGLAQTVANLGRSLVMNELGFSATAISSTGAVGALITFPLPILVGWLSDRVGRVQLLVLGYLACTTGLLVLAMSASLWHFWLVLGVMNILFATGSVASALATDLVPRESLGRGMSLLSTMGWVGSIIGYAGTGYAVQNLGTASTFRAGALLPLLAIGLLMSIRQAGQESVSVAPAGESPTHQGAAI